MIQPGLKGPREDKEQCGIVIKDEEPRRRNDHVTDDCAYTLLTLNIIVLSPTILAVAKAVEHTAHARLAYP